MIVLWSATASKDREDIIEYIAVENVMAAIHMDELFEHAAMLLTDHPIMGNQVTILTLAHTARLWPPTNLN